MIPILFSKDATAFNTNGLGRFTEAISCKVTESRNGQFELEMVYPISGAIYPLLETEMIIGAIPHVGGTIQAFDIYRITKPINGKVTIYAQHISYRLSQIVTTGDTVAASGTACAAALQSLKTNAILASGQTCPFTFWTDVTTVAGFKKSAPMSFRSRLGGSEGSILDQFGGEYEFDNFNVKLHHHRGSDTNITLMYGKNLTELTHEENISNAITGVVGYWKYESESVIGDVCLASNHESYARERIISLDVTQTLGTETTPTKSQVNTVAQLYANKHNLPDINMKISFVDLAQTEEYKEMQVLETVHLCDYVTIHFEKLKVRQKARIIKCVYNVLGDRYNSIEVGETLSTLAEAVTDTLAENLDEVSFAALNATQWLTRGNGYVVAIKNNDGSWRELLFMDTKDITTARNVLRLNTNGLGFSTTGVNGVYRNAWTIDGHLVADFIDTGTLDASKATITNLNATNITTGTLSADRIATHSINVNRLTGKIENNSNWELDFQNGTFSIGNISANNINTGTLSAERIAANSISVSKLTGIIEDDEDADWYIDLTHGFMKIGSMSANNITTGTLDAADVSVINLNASNITSGTLSASRIQGGTLTLGSDDSGHDHGSFVVYDEGNTLMRANSAGVFLRSDHLEINYGNLKYLEEDEDFSYATTFTVDGYMFVTHGRFDDLKGDFISGRMVTLGDASEEARLSIPKLDIESRYTNPIYLRTIRNVSDSHYTEGDALQFVYYSTFDNKTHYCTIGANGVHTWTEDGDNT